MKIKIVTTVIALCFAALLSGCGNGQKGDFVTGRYYNPAGSGEDLKGGGETGSDTQEQTEPADAISATEEASEQGRDRLGSDLFMIMSNDMQGECLILEQLASGKQYMYYYSLATRFLNRYGDRENVSAFDPGRVVTIGGKDSQGRVTEVQLSDQVWEYPDVTRYSVDEKRGVFKIAGTNYSFSEELYVNSDGVQMKLSDLTELDALRIVGVDKKLISISVTTGHGELELKNTDLFEGSFIQVGDRIFSEITKNMKMEIPEGTYTVTVANKGYGGSTDVTIEKGQTKVLDLDTLKGEGPKYGNILFAIDVAGAKLKIDGKTVDYSEAIPLQYGVHIITVTADSYDDYTKRLFVNSKEATIVIGLDDDSAAGTSETSSEKAEEETENSGTETESENGQAGSQASGSQDGAKDTEGTGTADSQTGNTGTGNSGTSNTGNGGTGGTGNSGTGSTGNSGNGTGGNGGTGITGEDSSGDILNGMISGNGSSSTADYLSTLSELLSALGGKKE